MTASGTGVPADEVLLLDTSVAVPFLVVAHPQHEEVFDALEQSVLGLCGHAAFETFSVLTRMPGDSRRDPAFVAHLLDTNFPASTYLSKQRPAITVGQVGALDVGGGAVYDALVGAAAAESGHTLVSRDQRAMDTYRAMGVRTVFL